MCKYCEERLDKEEIMGKEFELKSTAGFKNDRIYSAWIMKCKNDKQPGIMIATNGSNGVYFDINYCPVCRKEFIMNIDNNKPVNNILRYTIIFYEEETKTNTWGSNNVEYEIYYNSKDGIMQVHEIGAFSDSTLVAMYQDRRNRGITLKEMIENIEEISNMTYKEFKEKILKR